MRGKHGVRVYLDALNTPSPRDASWQTSVEKLHMFGRIQMPDAKDFEAKSLRFFTKTQGHLIHLCPSGIRSTEFISNETLAGQRSIGVTLFERTVLLVIPKEETVARLRSIAPRVPDPRTQNLSKLVLPRCAFAALGEVPHRLRRPLARHGRISVVPTLARPGRGTQGTSLGIPRSDSTRISPPSLDFSCVSSNHRVCPTERAQPSSVHRTRLSNTSISMDRKA